MDTSIIKIGDWIRFYTNSLRGPGATTCLAQITRLHYSRAGKRREGERKLIGLSAKNAQMGFECIPLSDVIEINPPITKGVNLL